MYKTELGRKIPREIDNFIDNILIDFSSFISPFLKQLNFTPNQITTIGNVFGLLCVKNLEYQNYKSASIFYLLRYICDNTDGFYSRKYNLETPFGDNYDHYSDYIFLAVTTYYLYFKVEFINKNTFWFIFIILFITSTIHLGCTEQFFQSKEGVNSHLNKLKAVCPKKNIINFIKYFGSGTFIIFVTLSLYYYTN
tara:strand:- start:2076 stop:2660 length:585 start_codon:yes stop_codon:yes gene_type:complete